MNNNREKLIETIDIVDEIGSVIELEAKGRNFVGLCPFHEDNNPSFTVSSEKQIYKCFVCGEGGDVVKFHRMYNHISNQAAIEALADKYNIQIDKKMPSIKLAKENIVLSDINKFYVTTLHSTAGGSQAIAYLQDRGFNIETINHFHLGFGYEQSDKLYQYLEAKIKNESQYELADIQKINHFTNERDLFSKRITIPIKRDGALVGFGGRALDNNNIRYLNSKDSQIFQKKGTLFHFDEALSLSPDKSIVVVEGFFDVIKGYQFNIKNAVGLMGTAFTSKHIERIKRRIETVYLALDQDQAGSVATLKIGRMLLKNKLKVKVIEYQGAKDLDEYLLTHDYNDFKTLQKNSLNFKLFETEQVVTNVNLLSVDEKDQATTELLTGLEVENDLVIEQVLTKLETSFKVSREYLMNKLEKYAKSSNSNPSFEEQSEQFHTYEYNQLPEMMDYTHDDQQYTHDVLTTRPLSNISFMSAAQLVVYRSMSSKNQYVELNRLKNQLKKDLGVYETLFLQLDKYYSKFSKFDYVTFTNENPQFSLLITDLFEKEINENEISNQKLINQIKNKTAWGIFNR